MNATDFNAYKSRYRAVIRRVLAETKTGRLDEAAFPAYSHRNPLINWLFWQRLRKVMDHVRRAAPHWRILDFGCGSGVMLPFLSNIGNDIVAMDVDLFPLQRVQEYLPLPKNVDVLDAARTSLADLPSNSFDLIIALDVLEHIRDLPRTLDELLALLTPKGELIVSGPTENVLYQLGRKAAGPEYSGAYHERGIAEIKRELQKIAFVEPIATLYPPVPLFEIFAAKRTGDTRG